MFIASASRTAQLRALSLAEPRAARDVPPGGRGADALPAAPLRESRRYNGATDIRWRVGSTRASQPFCCSGGSVPGGASRSPGCATGRVVCGRAPGGTPSGEPPLQRRVPGGPRRFCCSGGSVPGGASRSQGHATGQAVCGPAPGGTPLGEPPLQRRGLTFVGLWLMRHSLTRISRGGRKFRIRH